MRGFSSDELCSVDSICCIMLINTEYTFVVSRPNYFEKHGYGKALESDYFVISPPVMTMAFNICMICKIQQFFYI